MNLNSPCNQPSVSCSKPKICPGSCGLAHKHSKRMTDRFTFPYINEHTDPDPSEIKMT